MQTLRYLQQCSRTSTARTAGVCWPTGYPGLLCENGRDNRWLSRPFYVNSAEPHCVQPPAKSTGFSS